MLPNYCILKNNTYLCTRNRERLILIKNECLFSSVGQSTWFVISGSLVRIRQEAQTKLMRKKGQIPEWPNGADCKSAGLRLRWFESIFAHKKIAEVAQLIEHQPSKLRVASLSLVFRSKNECQCSSAVEHFLGKEEVTGSSPVIGSSF